MPHDPLCDWRPCTCPIDYDVPERGHMIGCPEDDCECEIIAKVRADTLDKARSLISALACPITVAEGHCEECEQYREALSCIDSLRGES